MYIVVQTRVFLANAMHARQTDNLTFEELNEFRLILARLIYDVTPYFNIAPMDEDFYEISKYIDPDLFFHKSMDGFMILKKPKNNNHMLVSGNYLVTEELLSKINNRYIDPDYKETLLELLAEARNKFQKQAPKLKPKKSNKQTIAFSSYGFK